MNNHATNSTCTDASGTSLRPVCKPIRTHMSRAFLRQFTKNKDHRHIYMLSLDLTNAMPLPEAV